MNQLNKSVQLGENMGLIRMYIENMIVYMIAALPFYIFFRIIFLKRKRKQIKVLHEVILAVFTIYIIALASQTIMPQWDFGRMSDTGKFYFDVNITNDLAKVNLIPFKTLYQYLFQTNAHVDSWSVVSLLNITGNILLFSPIGFVVPLLWAHWRSFKKMLLLGLAVTCFIEVTQLFIGRSTDIDDVILNTIGVLLGYGIFILLKVHKK